MAATKQRQLLSSSHWGGEAVSAMRRRVASGGEEVDQWTWVGFCGDSPAEGGGAKVA